MKMYLYLILILPLVNALREGEPCTTKGKQGECARLSHCTYAYLLITKNEEQPTHCGWAGNEEIVCCLDAVHTTGEYRDTFSGTRDGLLVSAGMSCRYDGEVPVICCAERPTPRMTPEPAGCPDLPRGPARPTNPTHGLIYDKCIEYQRYTKPCVSTDENPRIYKRIEACPIDIFGYKITGGDPAAVDEFPHMALLGYRDGVRTQWAAGGSLISDRFILTAGHVVREKQYGKVAYVLLGIVNKTDAREGLLYNVIQRIPHKSYNTAQKYNDIALLKLDRRVVFSQAILPACLPIPGKTTGVSKIITGWGRTGPDQKTSNSLYKTSVSVLDSSVCIRSIDPQALPRGWKADTQICAGTEDGDPNDSCEGDSGGPLQSYSEFLPCSYVVEGIVSFGPKKCGQGSPAVYTNVEAYLDWIVKNVWPDGK